MLALISSVFVVTADPEQPGLQANHGAIPVGCALQGLCQRCQALELGQLHWAEGLWGRCLWPCHPGESSLQLVCRVSPPLYLFKVGTLHKQMHADCIETHVMALELQSMQRSCLGIYLQAVAHAATILTAKHANSALDLTGTPVNLP